MVFLDCKEYIFGQKILIKYKKMLRQENLRSNLFYKSIVYSLSPLYLVIFFLKILILFLTKTAFHLLIRSKSIYKEIIKIILQIDQNNIKGLRENNYEKYLDFFHRIIELYHEIFVEKKSLDENIIFSQSKKHITFESLYDSEYQYVSGIYIITKKVIETLEKLNNDVLNISQATARDLNE
jgi:hypothetical protein